MEECDSVGNINFIYKSSSTKKGINSLRQEKNGSIWYRNHSSTNLKVTIDAETKNYIRLKSKFINGINLLPESGFSYNKIHLPSILEHYCSTWLNSSKSNLYNIHGDFSVGNIILWNSSPTIIDWEHFREEICPIGFDGLNLLFEQLWFEGEGKRLNRFTISELSNMINLLRERGALSHKFTKSPLKMVTEYIRNNSNIWNEQINKLPVLKFTENEVKKIDNIINKVIKN